MLFRSWWRTIASMGRVIPGTIIDRDLGVALAVLIAVCAFLLMRRSAKVAISVWLATVSFVPIWIGVDIRSFYVPLACAVALVAAFSLIPVNLVRFSLIDGLVLLLIDVAGAALFTGDAGIALTFAYTLVVYFAAGYALGRGAPGRLDLRWVYGAVAVTFSLVAVLAIVEFVTGWNPFILLTADNSSFAAWGDLQERGGVLRAEGAFGHSIALGSSLALAIPLTLASRFRFTLRCAMVLVMLLATVVTFSRIGMIGALLGIVLTVLFLRDEFPQRARVVLAIAVTVVTLALLPVVTVVFEDAGTEAEGSAQYRGDLLSQFGEMNLIGLADSARVTAEGELYFGNFQSIDSQLILTGLSSGTVALAAAVLALVAVTLLVLRGRASAATIAVVAQIPALATVALITQYSVFLWFVVGVAAASQVPQLARPTMRSTAPTLPRKSPRVRSSS